MLSVSTKGGVMKKVIRLILLFGLFCLLNQPIQAMAASARLICVNGKPGEDNIYFYSADFFYSGIKGYYIKGAHNFLG